MNKNLLNELKKESYELFQEINKLQKRMNIIDDIIEHIEDAQFENEDYEESYKSLKNRVLNSACEDSDNESYEFWKGYYELYELTLNEIKQRVSQ